MSTPELIKPNNQIQIPMTAAIKPAALSTNWKATHSSVQVIEMAHALRSIQKVIGYIDPRECRVTFNSKAGGHSSFTGKTASIVIDPAFALKDLPIKDEDFDVLVGLAVHESGHSLVQSDRVNSVPTLSGLNVRTGGEEIYVDSQMKRQYPVLGQYIRRARAAYNVDPSNINWDNLADAWIATAVYGQVPPIEAYQTGIKTAVMLQVLMELTNKLMSQEMNPIARNKLYAEVGVELDRLHKLQETYKTLQRQDKEAPPTILDEDYSTTIKVDPGEGGVDESEGGEGEEDGDTGGNETLPPDSGDEGQQGNEELEGEGEEDEDFDDIEEDDEGEEENDDPSDEGGGDYVNEEGDFNPDSGLNLDLVESLEEYLHDPQGEISAALEDAINQTLVLETEDITNDLKESYPGVVDADTNVVWQLADTVVETTFNDKLASQLIWLRELNTALGTQTYRNEDHGNLDRRKLYRANIDGRAFKQKKALPRQKSKRVILFDASGSMSGAREVLYDDGKAVFRALSDTIVLSYEVTSGYGRLHLGDSTVNIVQHSIGPDFHKVETGGGTPSGIALAAVAQRYPDAMILHFTDGGSNHGKHPDEVMPQILELYPDVKVVNVYLGSERATGGFARYGSRGSNGYIEEGPNCRNVPIKSVDEFPAAIQKILADWR